MGTIVNAVVQAATGLSTNLPSTAAGIAAALNIPVSAVAAGMLFFCTDTDELFVWDGTKMAVTSGTVTAGSITIADLASVEGNGSKVQLTSQGSTTLGDIATYDGSGNILDSGTLLSSVLTTSSSIANANLAHSSITIDGDGTIFSNTTPGAISLGSSGSLSLLSQTKNTFLAAPNGSNGNPTFRAILVADLPTSIPNANLANSSITINGDGSLLSSPGSTALGGTATFSLRTQTANSFLAAPDGTNGAPTFRSMLTDDLPDTGTWAFTGTFSGNYTVSGNGVISGNESHQNPTAAVSGTNQNSPTLVIGGTFWGANPGSLAVSTNDTYTIQNTLSNSPGVITGTGQITNISESAGSVVTLTLSSPGFTPAAGMSVLIAGMGTGKGDWLNGYVVTLLTGNTITCTFNDPTSHGTFASTATTGTPSLTQVSGLSTLSFTHAGSPGQASFAAVGSISSNLVTFPQTNLLCVGSSSAVTGGLALYSGTQANGISLIANANTLSLAFINGSMQTQGGTVTLAATSGLVVSGSGNAAISLSTSPTLTCGAVSNVGTAIVQNTVASTSSQSQSAQLNINGTYWTGSASAADSWSIENLVANGTNGTSTLTLAHSGTTGATQVNFSGATGNGYTTAALTYGGIGSNWGLAKSSGGRMVIAANGSGVLAFASTRASLASGVALNWSASTDPDGGTFDTGLSRISAGLVAVGNGTANSTTGTILANGGYGVSLVSTAAITGAVPVKADTSNANQVVQTTTSDTGSGVVIGVCINSPASSGNAQVITSGVVAMTLGTGTASIGQFVIVDTTTNGRVKCTSSYTAGTVIGVAMSAQASVGSTFNVMVGLR